MIKLGITHAMLLDFADGEQRRRPRLADGLVLALAPLDSGLKLLRLMQRLGVLDAAQVAYLSRFERTDEAEVGVR
jgi:hypothetical protein